MIVDGTVHRCDGVVIATGSAPVIPEITGLDTVDPWTNREAMEMRRVPASAAVLGAGPVGVEIGQMLSRYGCQVTLIGADDRLLDREEPAVGDLLGRALADDGIELLLGTTVTAAQMIGTSTRVTVQGTGPGTSSGSWSPPGAPPGGRPRTRHRRHRSGRLGGGGRRALPGGRRRVGRR